MEDGRVYCARDHAQGFWTLVRDEVSFSRRSTALRASWAWVGSGLSEGAPRGPCEPRPGAGGGGGSRGSVQVHGCVCTCMGVAISCGYREAEALERLTCQTGEQPCSEELGSCKES